MKTFHHPDPKLNGLRIPEPMNYERVRKLFTICPKTGLFLKKTMSKRYPLGGTTWRVGTRNEKGYVYIRIDGRSYTAARLMWLYHFKSWPTHRMAFLNGYIDDYRIDNLYERVPRSARPAMTC